MFVDAILGNVFVEPSEELLARHRSTLDIHARLNRDDPDITDETYTLDGTKITLLANINLLSELPLAKRRKMAGFVR